MGAGTTPKNGPGSLILVGQHTTVDDPTTNDIVALKEYGRLSRRDPRHIGQKRHL